MTFAEKIYTLRKKLGLTLEDVGNAVGVGKSTVRKWETGMIANMRRDKIAALARVLNTTPEYLLDWDLPSNTFPIRTKRVPLLGEIACGEPIYADERHGEYVITDEGVNADFCLKCVGDSMIGARIHDGDLVFVRKQSSVDNGEIAAVIIEDEATLKRVYFDGQTLILAPENPAYAPLIYSGEDLNRINILGKAVAFQSVIN